MKSCSQIVDDAGDVLPLGSMGAVLVKSVAMTSGYWGRPDLNEHLFHDDGFLVTGDAGLFGDEGCLYVRGRLGDVINFRGTKVGGETRGWMHVSHDEEVRSRFGNV